MARPRQTVASAVVQVLAVLLAAALWQHAFPLTAESTVTIDTSRGRVWSVLTKNSAPGAVNPGDPLKTTQGTESYVYSMSAEDIPTIPAGSTRHGDTARWVQQAGPAGLVDAHNSITVEPLANSSTRVTLRREYRGIAVYFFGDGLQDDAERSLPVGAVWLRLQAETLSYGTLYAEYATEGMVLEYSGRR